jgi:plastocyanin
VLALLLAGAGAMQFVPGSAAEGPTIEAAGPGSYGYYWRPSIATVGAGGTVSFKSTSASVPHGVTWNGGPEKPSCDGVPIDQEGTSWSGFCTFAQAGAYTFICPVHPAEMKGTITVSSAQALPGPPPGGSASESPLKGPASRALRLAKNQRGSSVRGSVNLSQAGAGGRLEVLLLARAASLSVASSARRRVGRLVRASLKAGHLPFAVPVMPVARRALRSRGKLALTVKVKVTPPGRPVLMLTRGVVLHG